MACAALDFPMYDASALAKDAESKLDGIIKQVSNAGFPENPVCSDTGNSDGLLQAEELTAQSEKRMKELEKEIQECERAMVRLSLTKELLPF